MEHKEIFYSFNRYKYNFCPPQLAWVGHRGSFITGYHIVTRLSYTKYSFLTSYQDGFNSVARARKWDLKPL